MSAEAPLPSAAATGFADLGLPAPLLRALADVGYESPSPIQQATIPPLLAGRDMVGQAQTGTGKTAAFALPILARLDLKRFGPQALVLTPTRELAIQVAEAFQRYAAHLPGFHVLPIYGGQAYGPQLGGLRRGAHVVVGTPGRVIDHLNRGTLDLRGLVSLVLDEGDEMLRMGFIDDVETVLKKAPEGRQVALFSATMPAQIRRIAQTHLRDPAEITIRNKTATVANTRQRYWMVSGLHKLDALTRILEAEPFDAMIVFARTKVATDELAQRLEARGFAASALNGDMVQAQRERTIARLKNGELDILVATDVAARGLDVERVSHVLNFDIPYDTEAYVHRIGRTGRAGRSGEAILFVTHREQHLLRAIERATGQKITPMTLPTVADVNDQRIARFKERITAALAGTDLATFRSVIEAYEQEHDVPAIEIAAALAKLAQGNVPLLVPPVQVPVRPAPERAGEPRQPRAHERHRDAARPHQAGRPRDYQGGMGEERAPGPETPREADSGRDRSRPPRPDRGPGPDMVRYRIAVGHLHGVKPGNIVGAIANEADLASQFIGRIDIREDHSIIDLPAGMPRELLRHLKKVWVAGQQLRIQLESEPVHAPTPAPDQPGGPPIERARRPGDAGLSAKVKRKGKPAKHKARAGRPRR